MQFSQHSEAIAFYHGHSNPIGRALEIPHISIYNSALHPYDPHARLHTRAPTQNFIGRINRCAPALTEKGKNWPEGKQIVEPRRECHSATVSRLRPIQRSDKKKYLARYYPLQDGSTRYAH